MNTNRSKLAAAACAAAVVMLPAGVASAEPPHFQEHYSDVFDELLPGPDAPADATFCGLVDVPVHVETQGVFSEKNQGNSAFPYFADRFRTTRVYTNPLTGLTFTTVRRGQYRDLHVVENEDATVSITQMFTGIQNVYGPDGELLFTDRGLVRLTFLIDSKGTLDQEDDEFLGEVGEPFIVGPHETFDNDFCNDFLAATTP